MKQDRGLVAMMERVADRATATLVGAYEDSLSMMGDRPAGFETADSLDLLAHFIDVCRTPGGWEQVIATDAAVIGQEAAEALTVKTVTNLARMLARRGTGGTVPDDPIAFQRAIDAGVESVEAAQLVRRMQRSEKALREVEKLDAQPKAITFDVGPPTDPMRLLVLSPDQEGRAL